MIKVVESETFKRWVRGLTDLQACARILLRVRRLESGNPGDVKPIGDGLFELRINHGLGNRAYFMQRGPVVAVTSARSAPTSSR